MQAYAPSSRSLADPTPAARRGMVLALSLGGLLIAAAAQAQDARPSATPPAPAASSAKPTPPEPKVQHVVLEDDSNVIEELRVRGQTVQAKVKPKGRAPEYEILLGEPGRDVNTGADSAKGGAGQRVWRLLSF